jgi:hypothetical protein
MPEFSDDFLDVPADTTPAHAEEVTTPAPRRRMPVAVATAAWLAVGLVVGAVGVAALHSTNTTNGATGIAGAPAAAANQIPGAAPRQGFAGGPPPGAFGGPGGGLAGEQHIMGTLAAVGSSSITVKSSAGTATYPIESSTVLVKDGRRVSSLSALTVGDTVVVHVYPQNGSNHVELVLDGAPRGADGSGSANGGTGTTTET